MNGLEREIGGSPSKEEIGEKDHVSHLAAYIVQEEDGS